MAFFSLLGGLALGSISATSAKLRVSVRARATGPTLTLRADGDIDVSDAALLSAALALLPPGRVFEAPDGTRLRAVVDSLARDLSRPAKVVRSLVRQLLPGQPGELLEDWERATRLDPDAEAFDFAETQRIEAELAALGVASTHPSLESRRARAVIDHLLDDAPFTLDELRRRAFQAVVYRYVDAGAPGGPREVVTGFSDVVFTTRAPFKVGHAAVGSPLCGEDWRFLIEATFITTYSIQADPWTANQARRSAAPLWNWIRRTFPPWCALRVYVQRPGSANRASLLNLNVTSQEPSCSASIT
ncbi:MAG: hypothetical protein LBM75_09155 [Myxococcales bacterium]|jgi:hypothetical protein|nr:hypothetical protein [Myxococcales bacterium]